MVTATRLLLIVLIIVSIPIYLVFIVPEGVVMQAAGAVLILLLVSMILFTGRTPVPMENRKNTAIIEPDSDFGDIELPLPVLSEESVAESRDSKIQRSRGRRKSPGPLGESAPEPMPKTSSQVSIDIPQIPMLEDDGETEGTARVHVAKSDPELQAEAEVDQYLAQQRERRAIFRERLHRERRLEMSKRLADEARKWSQSEDGEDLSTLTSIPGHGLAVFYEPEEPDASIPQGVSYVRIDDERVLKVRVSLDVPGSEASHPQETMEQADGLPAPISPETGVLGLLHPLPDLPPPIGTEDNL